MTDFLSRLELVLRDLEDIDREFSNYRILCIFCDREGSNKKKGTVHDDSCLIGILTKQIDRIKKNRSMITCVMPVRDIKTG